VNVKEKQNLRCALLCCFRAGFSRRLVVCVYQCALQEADGREHRACRKTQLASSLPVGFSSSIRVVRPVRRNAKKTKAR